MAHKGVCIKLVLNPPSLLRLPKVPLMLETLVQKYTQRVSAGCIAD